MISIWPRSVASHKLLTGISSLSGEGHECVRVQLPCLVVLRLNDGRTSHYGLGCGHNDEVFAGDAQENLPSTHRVLVACRRIDEQYVPGTYIFAMSGKQA